MTTDPASMNMGDSHLVVDICLAHNFPAWDGSLSGDGRPRYGVEIGCYRGATSQELLKAFPELTLCMVDSWKGDLDWDDPYLLSGDGVAKLTQEQQDENQAAAERATLFDGMAERRVILKLDSKTAEQRLGGRWFDFCFIDGDHRYEAVKEDIEIWYPRVKEGGLLIGHDFRHKRYPGVEQAVKEFVEREDLDGFGCMGSCWYVEKPFTGA